MKVCHAYHHSAQSVPVLNVNIVTVEAVIGLREWPDQFNTSFSFINGMMRTPKHVSRAGIAALGYFQPHDIGKRVHNGQVENDEQITRRTGLNIDQRKVNGLRMIAEANKRYKGCSRFKGLYSC